MLAYHNWGPNESSGETKLIIVGLACLGKWNYFPPVYIVYIFILCDFSAGRLGFPKTIPKKGNFESDASNPKY